MTMRRIPTTHARPAQPKPTPRRVPGRKTFKVIGKPIAVNRSKTSNTVYLGFLPDGRGVGIEIKNGKAYLYFMSVTG